jgi:hypothetical protein
MYSKSYVRCILQPTPLLFSFHSAFNKHKFFYLDEVQLTIFFLLKQGCFFLSA